MILSWDEDGGQWSGRRINEGVLGLGVRLVHLLVDRKVRQGGTKGWRGQRDCKRRGEVHLRDVFVLGDGIGFVLCFC